MKRLFMDKASIIHENKMKIDEKNNHGIIINHFKVDNASGILLKKIKGDYFVINFDYVSLNKKSKIIKKELIKILKFFLNGNIAKTLIIGLGNSSIECDSLGINTTKKIMATNHYNDFLSIPKVALFNPEIIEKTGISSFDLIEMVVKKIKPTIIIMIDSLATNSEQYLNNCIEINNTGIIPASSIKDNKKIDANTFGIPLIAIGVPLILERKKELYTTPNVGKIIELTSDIISEAFNELLF